MAHLMARPAGTATRASHYGGVGGVDITRTDNGYSVEIPAPGFKPSEIDVTFENGMLTLTLSVHAKAQRKKIDVTFQS